METAKGIFRQPRQYNQDCNKSASQFILDADDLCKVSDFDLQSGKDHLPKLQSMQNQERAIFWLYNHNLADSDGVRSIIVKSSCNLQNKKEWGKPVVYNLRNPEDDDRELTGDVSKNDSRLSQCREERKQQFDPQFYHAHQENLQRKVQTNSIDDDLRRFVQNNCLNKEELQRKQQIDGQQSCDLQRKLLAEHQANQDLQRKLQTELQTNEDLHKKLQNEELHKRLLAEQCKRKFDDLPRRRPHSSQEFQKSNKEDLQRKDDLRWNMQNDLLVIEELHKQQGDPQTKQDLHRKLHAERDCCIDKEIEVVKRMKAYKSTTCANRKEKIGIKYHDECINLDSVETEGDGMRKRLVRKNEKITQTPNIGTEIGIQNGGSGQNAKAIQTDEIQFSREEIIQLLRDSCTTCNKGVGVNMGNMKEGARNRPFKNDSTKGTQMYEHITESDLYTLDWINYNLFSVNVNPHNLIIDQKLRDISETTTGKSSVVR